MALPTTSGPFWFAKPYSKSDTVGFEFGTSDAIWVGTTGIVVAIMQNGEAVTFTGVPAGAILPIAATRINSTTTTAGAFVILYVSKKEPQTGVA